MRTNPSRLLAVPALLAAGALVAACSGGVGTAAGPINATATARTTGSASAPARPAATPSSTSTGRATVPVGGPAGKPVPATLMLRAADLQNWNHQNLNVATSVPVDQTEPSACQVHTAFPSDRHWLAARMAGFIYQPADESGELKETVVRYAPGWAQRHLDEARRVLARCRGYVETLGTGTGRTRYTIRYVLERKLPGVGDDALLIRRSSTVGSAGVELRYLTLVRIGGSVITIQHEIGEGVAQADLAVRLARLAATRAACLRSTC